MDLRAKMTIRTKKLGLLMHAARLAERRTVEECSAAMGITPASFTAYERGDASPSLPELEFFVHFLRLPITRFWGREVISEIPPPAQTIDLVQLRGLRQRMVGALLRQQRNQANITPAQLAQGVGIAPERITDYEMGELPIPVAELEALVAVLSGRIETFFDQSGPVGQWMTGQRAMEKFLELPDDLQTFVCQPVNRPYLELAMKLSEMPKERLRAVAEGLLDITL